MVVFFCTLELRKRVERGANFNFHKGYEFITNEGLKKKHPPAMPLVFFVIPGVVTPFFLSIEGN